MKIKTELAVPAGMYCTGCRYQKDSRFSIGGYCPIYCAAITGKDGTHLVKCGKCLLACAAELRK